MWSFFDHFGVRIFICSPLFVARNDMTALVKFTGKSKFLISANKYYCIQYLQETLERWNKNLARAWYLLYTWYTLFICCLNTFLKATKTFWFRVNFPFFTVLCHVSILCQVNYAVHLPSWSRQSAHSNQTDNSDKIRFLISKYIELVRLTTWNIAFAN